MSELTPICNPLVEQHLHDSGAALAIGACSLTTEGGGMLLIDREKGTVRMLCVMCTTVDRLALEVPKAGGSGERAAGASACDRCGRPVCGDLTELLVSKLAQLARFGLAGRMLLAPRRRLR